MLRSSFNKGKTCTMILPITLTTAAAAALTHIWLSTRCIRLRFKENVSIGDGGNKLLSVRMRSHANFSENAPIFLILLGLVELGSGKSGWLWATAIAFILARIAHAFGMERRAPNLLRMGGMIVTFLTLIALAVQAILLSYAPATGPMLIG